MTKTEFMLSLSELYITGNRADSSDKPSDENWTKAQMSGNACCAVLDKMLIELVVCGALTKQEHKMFYIMVSINKH